MIEVRKVLCPVDFSETSRHALDYAALFARQCGAELIVVHVVEDVPLLTAYAGLPDAKILNAVEKSAQKELADLVAGVGAGTLRVRSQLLHGATYRAILRYAEEQRADLIVMGTHGRSGLEHHFFGSVTERVMRRAPCPVLVVRQAEARAAPQAARK